MRRPAPQEIYRHFKGRLYQVLTMARHSGTDEDMVVYQALYEPFTVYCRSLEDFTSPVDRERYPEAGQKLRFELIGGRMEDGRIMLRGKASEAVPEDAGSEESDNAEETAESSAHAEESDSAETVGKSSHAEESDSAETFGNSGHTEAVDSAESSGREGHDAETGSDTEDSVRVVRPDRNAGEVGRKRDSVMDRSIEEEARELGMDPLVVSFLDADSCEERLQILERLRSRITNDMIDILAIAMDTEIPGADVYERYSELRESLYMRKRFEATRLRS